MGRLVLALVVLAACAPMQYPKPLTVTVVSQSWNADAVRIVCNGSSWQIGMIPGITLNSTESRTMNLGACHSVYIFADVIGRRYAWRSLEPVMVQPGDSLTITLAPSLPLTSWVVR